VTALCRDCGVLAASPIRRDRCDACDRRARSTMPCFTPCRSPMSIATPFTSRSKNAAVPILPIVQ
jgi:hypothetical protein